MDEEKKEPVEKKDAAECEDLSGKVMEKIKTDKVAMTKPFVFLAEKIELESLLVLLLLFGAFVLSTAFYFLARVGALQFLSFGWPGMKVVLMIFPYDYLGIVLLLIFMAVYVFRKLQAAGGQVTSSLLVLVCVLLIIFAVGICFSFFGIKKTTYQWNNYHLLKQVALYGQVEAIGDHGLLLREEDGAVTRVLFASGADFPYLSGYALGKFARAVGERDPQHPDIFHAHKITCCEDAWE